MPTDLNKYRTTPTNERVPFRLLRMECCGHLLCWINTRLPTYCPECGANVYARVRAWVAAYDDSAHIRYSTTADRDIDAREAEERYGDKIRAKYKEPT